MHSLGTGLPYPPKLTIAAGTAAVPITVSQYLIWPWQERRITGYDMSTGWITVHKAWDVDMYGGSTLTYDILPRPEPILMSLASLEVARKIHGIERRRSAQSAVTNEYDSLRTTARRQLANANMVRPIKPPHPLDSKRIPDAGGVQFIQSVVSASDLI